MARLAGRSREGEQGGTLVKKEWLEARTLEEVVIEGVDILDRIRKSKAVDDEVVKIVEEMKRANVKVLRNKE